LLHHPGIYVAPTEKKGLGVFTHQPILEDDIIEICPIIIIPPEQVAIIDPTIFYHYYFTWDHPENSACIALGYGSIYNHSFSPNAEVVADDSVDSLTIKCIRNIHPGEEICIDYCGGIENIKDLWFELK
jgi:SET domain-containing protein